MSMITENTIAIKPDAEERVMNDLAGYGCSGINKVFQNDKMVIILFDNNGDNPWDIQGTVNTQADWEDFYVIETNYGDSDGYWTQIFTPEDRQDSDKTFLHWVKHEVTPEEYAIIKKKTRYTF